MLLLLVAVVGISTSLVNHNKQTLKAGLEIANQKGLMASEMKSALMQGGIAMRNMLDISTVATQKARVDTQAALYKNARAKLLKMPLQEEERSNLRILDQMEKAIEPRYRMAISQAEAFNAEGAASVITKFIDPMNLRSVEEIDKLLKSIQNEEARVIAKSESADKVLMAILLSMTVFALLLGGAISFVITRSITKPLNQAVNLAAAVASGDLTTTVDDHHSDEIGKLFLALKSMNASLSQIIDNVRATSNLIRASAEKTALDSTDLSARTSSQAASLQETASAMEELTGTVRQNAENAQQANVIVQAASDVAGRGGQVVTDVVNTMEAIRTGSKKVVEIISVIDGIAFQTNILALNAAVEAARAGEQGRGFAVVASEVRALAQRSASAASEIKHLISDSVGKIDAGAVLVDEAGDTMKEVVSSVRRINVMMAEVLTASEEQRAGIEEISQAVMKMDRATQQNASLVDNAAAAAEELSQQAQKLDEAVSVFRLGSDNCSATNT